MSLHKYKKGFTLVELLVSIMIFVIMTALFVVKYNNFGHRMNLTNTAYDIALTIRQAQQYGINVSDGGSGDFTRVFGVYFASTTNEFLLYRKNDSGNVYDNDDEVLKKYKLKDGIQFAYLCRGAATFCVTNYPFFSISFRRPDPMPILGPNKYTEIGLFSSKGATSTIIMRSTGQISIKE